MDFTIEPLTPSAWERYRRIRLRALKENPEAFGSVYADQLPQPDSFWINRLKQPNTAILIAVTDSGEDVGLAVGAPEDDETAAGLFSLWVAASARRSGVAGRLVDAVIDWAFQSGYPKLLLDVGDLNHAAISLYASRGFVPTGKTGNVPPPRENLGEHQRVKILRP